MRKFLYILFHILNKEELLIFYLLEDQNFFNLKLSEIPF